MSTKVLRTIILRRLVPGSIIFVAAATLAAPAVATNYEPDCQSGEICLFKDTNFGGAIHGWTGNDGLYDNNTYQAWDGRDYPFPSVNDTASSLDNDGRSCSTTHYVAAYSGGESLYVPRGASRSNLFDYQVGNYPITFNDILSSHRWC